MHRFIYPRLLFGVVVSLAISICSAAIADDAEATELAKQLQTLRRQAAELRESGRNDKAAEFHQKAAQVAERLEKLKRRPREEDPERRASTDRREQQIQQILAAAKALQELGRPEEARRLMDLGRDLKLNLGRERRDSEQQWVRRQQERAEREHAERDERAVERKNAERERRAEQRPREDHPEIRAARDQVVVLQMAMKALVESDRAKGANQLEHAIHAVKLAIEGRRDEEAREVRESAPSRGNQVEWLMLAQRILQEKKQKERAQAVGRLAERMASRGSQRPGGNEREVAARHLEIMRMALPALREAGRQDSAQILQRAVRAREVALEGRRDDEANKIRENAPPLGHVVEILALSANLWREYENPGKAEVIAELAEHFKQRWRRGGQEERNATLERVQTRIRELSQELDELRAEVEHLQE